MSLILRIDVDKSYGRSTFIQKVTSKIAENYWLPSLTSFGYLHDLIKFLVYLSEANICAHIYFRRCSLPPMSLFDGELLNGHKLGLHAEDTRSFETFKKELEDVQNYFNSIKLSSFTKHGSGKWKSGRYHYPPYEPEKYMKWAEQLEIPIFFGNKEDIYEPCQDYGKYTFYPGAYWIDRPYTDYEEPALQEVIKLAKERNIVVLIHCADFLAIEQVQLGMKRLVTLAKEESVSWITL